MLTQKQEAFCINYFEMGNATQAALMAGYAPRYARNNVPKLLHNTTIQQRIAKLREQAASEKVMTVQGRKERLSEIARANLPDYQETGLDSGYISIGKDSPNPGAIAGLETSTKFDENGNTGTLFTKVKLHNPIQAIAELNKMDKVYDERPGVTINADKVIVDAKGKIMSLLGRRVEALGEGKKED